MTAWCRGNAGGSGEPESLAGFLQYLKVRAGCCSFEGLARRTGLTESQIRRMISGKHVPVHWPTVEKVVKALLRGAGEEESEAALQGARDRWCRARARGSAVPPAPVPSEISTFVELVAAMKALRVRAGSPASQVLEKRAGELGRRLSHSTLDRVFKDLCQPGRELVVVFAEVCGVPEEELPQWGDAVDRAVHHAADEDALLEADLNRRAAAERRAKQRDTFLYPARSVADGAVRKGPLIHPHWTRLSVGRLGLPDCFPF